MALNNYKLKWFNCELFQIIILVLLKLNGGWAQDIDCFDKIDGQNLLKITNYWRVHNDQRPNCKIIINPPQNFPSEELTCSRIKDQIFRIRGDFGVVTLNCTASFHLNLDYDGFRPTEAVRVTHWSDVDVDVDVGVNGSGVRSNYTIQSKQFGVTVRIKSIRKMFDEYLDFLETLRLKGEDHQLIQGTLQSPIVYPRTGKFVIRGIGPNKSLQQKFYFFFEEPLLDNRISFVKNQYTMSIKPSFLIGTEGKIESVLIPCRPSHYIHNVSLTHIRPSQNDSLEVFKITMMADESTKMTFDPTKGFLISADYKLDDWKNVQFECAVKETKLTLGYLNLTGEMTSKNIFGLSSLNMTSNPTELVVSNEHRISYGDYVATLRCSVNTLNPTSAFYSYGWPIKTMTEMTYSREFVLPTFSHLSYYVQKGHPHGSETLVIERENGRGVYFCTDGQSYNMQEYVGSNFNGRHSLYAPGKDWENAPYFKAEASRLIHIRLAQPDLKLTKKLYSSFNYTFTCHLGTSLNKIPTLWFIRSRNGSLQMVFKDLDDSGSAEKTSRLEIQLGSDFEEISCVSSIWQSNYWRASSIKLNITEGKPPTSMASSNFLIIGLLIGAILILGAIGLFFYIRAKNSKAALLTMQELRDFRDGIQSRTQNDYSLPLSIPYKVEYEIPASDFTTDKNIVLGSGAFGIVMRGSVKGEAVAVKTVHEGAEASFVKSLLTELKILIYLEGHPNLIRLIGANTTNVKNGVVFVFVELCELGNLLSYLQEHRNDFLNSQQSNLNPRLLHSWALQIAKGMTFLASKNVLHGDLAARNVLISSDKTVKITDFGLSRQLQHYALYTKKNLEPLPWRWMPPESLADLKFSTASDVWSYGVTLWELYSLGQIPFPGMSWTLEFVDMLKDGIRMGCPTMISKDLFTTLICPCWEKEPKDRPNFDEICQKLENLFLKAQF